MTAQNLPPTKPAGDLKLGDHVWATSVHPDLDGVAEVMFVHPYAEYSTEGVTVVLWYGGTTQVESVHVALDREVQMASAEEIAATRERAERAKQIADIRALADFLERNLEIPIGPSGTRMQVDLRGMEGLRTVRDLGARFDQQPEERLYDRTAVNWAFGDVDLSVIAWHEDGRPVEPKPLVDPDASMEAHYDAEADGQVPHPSWPTKDELKPWESLDPAARRIAESMEPIAEPNDPEPALASGRELSAAAADADAEAFVEAIRETTAQVRAALAADPTGLAYIRADTEDDPAPVSPARVPLHTGGVVDGGQLVDETPPVHLEGAGARTACDLRIIRLPTGQSWTEDHAKVTCKACIEMPF